MFGYIVAGWVGAVMGVIIMCLVTAGKCTDCEMERGKLNGK